MRELAVRVAEGRAEQAEETARAEALGQAAACVSAQRPMWPERARAQHGGGKVLELGAGSCQASWAIVRVLAFTVSDVGLLSVFKTVLLRKKLNTYKNKKKKK